MSYQSTDELMRKLSILNKVEATKRLTEFYSKARFKLSPEDFSKQYADGGDDGGIDFYHIEDSTYFIFQTKFTENSKKTSESEIQAEIQKIQKTLTNANTNHKADDFVNALKRNLPNKEANLEIIWLTTNIVNPSTREIIAKQLNEWKTDQNWQISTDFMTIDKYALESVIYDIKHGYVPYTGKKVLKLEKGQFIENSGDKTNVYSVVCTVNVNDILKWFPDSAEVDKFLQKNVREFLGESSKINKDIAKSYEKYPDWFWYKHNGVIVFADSVFVDKTSVELVLRNPQVVNGGQTLKSLFMNYDKNNRKDNSSKILLRAYRLPYEDTETYKRSIEIISALNSQNRINPSDLRSTDPRQVRIENLLTKIGDGYKYIRKRSKEAKSSRYSITMRNLAIRYLVCKRYAPHEGLRGDLEDIFEEDAKYNDVFDENAINKEQLASHIVLNYVTCWSVDQALQKTQLTKADGEYYAYTKWFALADTYRRLNEWKQSRFDLGWQMWAKFIECSQFEKAVQDYGKTCFRKGREIIPQNQEARAFLRTTQATVKFKSQTSKRSFDMAFNKAYALFKKQNGAT
jgi:hypothetical protein